MPLRKATETWRSAAAIENQPWKGYPSCLAHPLVHSRAQAAEQCAGASEQPPAIFLHQEQWSDVQSPLRGLDVAVHKSPSMCGCREVSCSKKSPWDVHRKTGHTPWSCTQPPAATPSGDGDHSVRWCWLSLMASSPHPLNEITHLTEEELSFFPVPLQKPLCITACLQPETGAARASLPGWAEALQLIRLSLPHHYREWDQSAPNPCYRSAARVSNEVDPACAGRL